MTKTNLNPYNFFPQPLYAPELDPAYKNELKEITKIARLMGTQFMPWQSFAIERATQYKTINGHRQYKYKQVLITVPRQSGKTTLVGPVQLHRMLTRPQIPAFYTAQTGADAGKRMRALIGAVEATPISQLFIPRLSNGAEGFICPGNGSTLTRFSPTLGAMHGDTPHLVTLDEIWKLSQTIGDYLMGAIRPGQITLSRRAQIWMISTMGTMTSEFMNNIVDLGRAGDPNIAYFEWALPSGQDPYDPAAWWKFHPALGNTITERDLQDETNLPYAEWLRAYCNRLTEAEDPIIPLEEWETLAEDPDAVPSFSNIAIAYEVAPQNACSAVTAAWRDKDGQMCIRVLHQAPGASWLPDYIAAMYKAGPAVIAADDGGPTRRMNDEVRARIGEDILTTLKMTERGTADGNLLAAARDEKTLKHDGSQVLRIAVANAVLKSRNGIEMFDRDKSTAPIPSLIAGSVAAWAYDHQPEDPGVLIF